MPLVRRQYKDLAESETLSIWVVVEGIQGAETDLHKGSTYEWRLSSKHYSPCDTYTFA